MAISETRKRFNAAFRDALKEKGSTFEFEGTTYSKKMLSDVKSNPKKVVGDVDRPRGTLGDDEPSLKELAFKTTSPKSFSKNWMARELDREFSGDKFPIDGPKARKLDLGSLLSLPDRPGPTVARAKEMQAARDRRDALDKRDALETDTTLEETAAIAPGLLRMAGKKLFGSAKKGAEEYVKKDPSFYDDLFPKIGYDKNVTAAPTKAEMMTKQRAERAAEKYQEMLQENAQRYGIDMETVPQAGLDYIKKEVLGRDQGFKLKKKGGMIKKYAKGGSADKSPSRGNGCAVRGLTKGKQY